MIEKMSHYTFLVYHKDYVDFLERVRDLGVLHVSPTQEGNLVENSTFQALVQQSARYEKLKKEMFALLKKEDLNNIPAAKADVGDLSPVCAQWQEISSQVSVEQKNIADLDKEIHEMAPWGDFSHNSIDGLNRAGWETRFWVVPLKNFDPAWAAQYNALTISETKAKCYFITLTPAGTQIELPQAEPAHISPSPISTLIMLQTRAKDNLKRLLLKQGDFALLHISEVEAALNATRDNVDLHQVELTTAGEADGRVMLLEGWVPSASQQELNSYLESRNIYYSAHKATPEDKAPVKLHNNWFSRLFQPITQLYDMPNYGEWDLTPMFAPFFVLFFGLCLGDAGYGLLLLILGIVGLLKMKKSMRPIMQLVCVMGIGTMIFGFLSGTFFGIPFIKETSATGDRIMQWSWLDNFKDFILDSNQLFYASLIIGIFQIIFGMIMKAIRFTIQYGFGHAISTWGWLCVIVGCGGTAALSHFGQMDADTADTAYMICGGVGALGIFLFNNPKRNPLINIGAGIWDTYNMASGLLGDVLSYVRLFALGISGAVLGLVFNDLAMQAKLDIPVVGWILPLIILLFGHGVNIFMSGLSAFVHPMRLTFVEFYKSAGFEGGGMKYQPLAHHKTEE